MVDRPRRTLLRLALLLSLAACTVDRGLIGLPRHEGKEAGEQAALLLEDVRTVERAIDDRFGPPQPGAAPRDARQLHAHRAVLAAQLALCNEHFDYGDPRQRIDPGRPPLVLYPRLISPAIPEPTAVQEGDGPARTHWFVPFLLRKETLFWTDSVAHEWFGIGQPRIEYDNPGRYFGVFLVPHHQPGTMPANRIDLVDHFLVVEPLPVALSDGTVYALPHVVPEHLAMAFAIPMHDPASGTGVAPGFYHLRVVPRLELGEIRAEGFGPWREQLSAGDWYGALVTLQERRQRTHPAAQAAMRADASELARAIRAYPPAWFAAELDPIQEYARRAAEGPDLAKSLRELEREIRRLVAGDPNPARVLLEAPPADPDEPFSFVVGADLQYSGDMTFVHQFLGMIDGALLPLAGTDEAGHALITGPMLDRLRRARFVVIVGDLSDGAALSSTPGRAIGDALGLSPPYSPYLDDFADLKREFARFRLPIFAVPGNHDGFANYGGVTNDVAAGLGDVLRWPVIPAPIHYVTHPIGTLLDKIGAVLPPILKLGRLGSVPYSDGLVQWHFDLGPLHFAFRYRGHTFVGLNSYNLDVQYRDQIGALANNWGGGVDQNDAVWFDLMLRWLRPPATADGSPRHQFAFLHQDPRAGRPFLRTYQEGAFGAYDAADAPLNTATFGYLGLGWSPHNPLWLPILTPIATNLPRQLLYGDAKFNQEWILKDSFFDEDMYGARQLIGAINENLAGPANQHGLSHLFFGHDDVPAPSRWIHEDQAGHVFPAPPGATWGDSKWGAISRWTTPLFRQRTSAPPGWARDMVFDDGRNALVLRCDDVGQSGSLHGFHLVTVDPRKPRGRQVAIEWIQIPR
ncbi:MAG: metallophosphoesterase [Planctomycetes bacterium]|nr:metallophosphoesterase [Planctomycetota bacterium]